MSKYAGVDISRHNSDIDYKKLKAARIDGRAVKFAMLRSSYGCTKDVLLDRHYKNCKSVGLYVGVYHWLRAQSTAQAKQEAEWLCRLLRDYELDYPVALDFEDGDLFALNLTKAQYSAIIEAFMTVLEKNNYYVVLYTNPDSVCNRITPETLRKYDLWLAHWTHGKPPAQYGQTMWQYAAYGTAAQVRDGNATDVGTVSGSGGPIDVDISYVGYAALIKKQSKNQPISRLIAEIHVPSGEVDSMSKKLKALGCSVKVDK